MAGNREYKMAIKIAGEIDKSFPNAAKLTKSELRAIAKEASSSSSSMSATFRQGINQTQPMFDKMGRVAKKAVKTTVTAASAASAAVGAFAVHTGMEYESQMSTVKALSQASEADMMQLDKTAKNLGATTVWTAKESGQAMEYMAMAGWNAKEMVDAVPATMDLASASGEELALVSDIVTDSMTAFGLQANKAGHFSDVLAAAATSSNTNVGKLGESFKYAAPLAGSLSYNIEDTAFSLGLMANSGIKASQAGVSMRAWLTRMAKPTKESYAAMKKLGLSLEDSHGKMKPLRTQVDETRNAFKGLTESQKAEYAAMLAGKTGMSGLLAIVNSTDKDYKKLRRSIEECDGAAKEMAETKLDNLEGDVTLFKSAMDGAGMEIYEELKDPLREIVSNGSKWVSEFAKNFKTHFPTIRRNVMEAGEAINKFASPLLSVGGWLLDHPDVIVGTLTGIGTALVTYKLVSGISNLATSLTSLGTGGLAVMGITGAIGVISGVAGAVAEAEREAKEASLDKHFGDIALSMEEIQSISKEIVGAKKLERISELMDSMSKSKGYADELRDASATLNKLDWKTSLGIEFSKGDKADYESSVRQYISSAQNLIDQKGYEVNIATSLLFEEGPEKTQLLKDNDYFYNQLDGEVSELSGKIEEKLQKGLKKGFSPDLQEEIDGLMSEMSEITNALTEAEAESSWEFLKDKWSGKDLDAESFKNLKKEIQDNVKDVQEGAENAYHEGVKNAGAKKKLGYIDQKEYEAEKQKYKDAYEKTVEEAEANGQSFLYNSVMDTYGEKLANDSMTRADSDAAKEMFDDVAEINPTSTYGINASSIGVALDTDWRADVGQFMEEFEVSWGLRDKTTKDASKDTSTKLAKDYLKEKEGKKETIDVQPQITSKDGDIVSAMENIKTTARSILENGTEVKMPIEVKGEFSSPAVSFNVPQGQKTGKKKKGGKLGKVEPHANGGIFSTPHMGMVAEAGYSEAIIPIDGSANAYNLLGQTAQLLGVSVGTNNGMTNLANQILVQSNGSGVSGRSAGNQSSQPIVIQYSPTIKIEGNADREMVEGVLSDEYENFKRYMKRWEKEGGRVSLA